ncbi:oligosaccharyl transferase beta subunit [Macrolepiota fuliginosa MF-IS2]|uniref:Dolichyl-diphosphooligosaccharide--protein glycosyltransferase subunit WBP1 n=1 Tax=Macrolepiota fuliginosa MF-IS2 TaxID=1400762 RepID=A0A9P5XQ26_9AGAR|nr:oligosaccharyl transferase beta subunit [Macrolepiota fuliginosa MF-IS2]
MVAFSKLFWLAVAFASSVYAKSSTGDSVLVIVEPKKRDDYNIFFDGLREKGYELTFRSPRADSPVLIEDDVPNFSHVVLFASESKSFAKDISPQSLVTLLNQNTNLLIALSTKQTPLTSLAAEFSLTPAPPGTPLISYFPERSDAPNVIPISIPKTHSQIITANTAPVWYSGTSFALGNNPLLVPILSAPAHAFAAEVDGGSADSLVDAAEKGGEGLWAGSQLGVVAGFQARTGARIVWTGGVEMFSDEYAQKEVAKGVPSGNKQFAQDTAAWAFQESQVLRIDKIEHHKLNATAPSEQYTINDQLIYTAYISKFNPDKGTWQPYSGLKDLQLEFTMLDPHVRVALPADKGTPGKYSVQFRAPDRHGVFKFIVDYKRKGLTHLFSSTTVPVVPPRHDGYPRFLSAAWPYYIGAISTSVGFFLFSTIWLAGEIKEVKKGKGHKAE